MTASITPSVDIDRLSRRLQGGMSPAELRSSERRRRRLENWSRTMADQELHLRLEPQRGKTAAVDLSGQLPRVRIPSWECPQPVTDFERPPYDYLMQRTLAIHEVGHIRYTDQSAVDDVIAQVDPSHRKLFHKIWNALEDGAIEEQLRHDFAVADELAVMNANFGEAGAHGVRSYGLADAIIMGCLNLAVYDSGQLASLVDPTNGSIQFKDSVDRSRFVSQILPELQDASADIVTEPDPEARAERVLELWRELVDLIDIDDLEEPQVDDGGKGDHATQDSGKGERADGLDDLDRNAVREFTDDITGTGSDSTDAKDGSNDVDVLSESRSDAESGVVDGDDSSDTDTNTDGVTDADADAQRDDEPVGRGDSDDVSGDQNSNTDIDTTPSQDKPDANASEDNSDTSTPITDSEESLSGESGGNPSRTQTSRSHSSDRDHPTDQQSDDSESDNSGLKRRQNDPATTVDDFDEKYHELVDEQKQEAAEVADDRSEELQSLQEAIKRIADDGNEPKSLDIVEPGPFRSDAWPDTKRNGKRLQRILERRLQEERRGSIRRGLRSGRVDPRLLTRIKRNNPKLFRKREKPDEKEYATVIIIDRSGSMRSSIESTEEASTSLTYALSLLGIDTCVIDVGGSSPSLAKPFGVAPEQSLETLLTGKSGGSTPLSPALCLARERLEDREEFPFVIILTDGEPDNRKQYLKELAQCQFPVLGVYINYGGRSNPASVDQSDDLFDHRQIVTDRNRLDTELRNLCESVMF